MASGGVWPAVAVGDDYAMLTCRQKDARTVEGDCRGPLPALSGHSDGGLLGRCPVCRPMIRSRECAVTGKFRPRAVLLSRARSQSSFGHRSRRRTNWPLGPTGGAGRRDRHDQNSRYGRARQLQAHRHQTTGIEASLCRLQLLQGQMRVEVDQHRVVLSLVGRARRPVPVVLPAHGTMMPRHIESADTRPNRLPKRVACAQPITA